WRISTGSPLLPKIPSSRGRSQAASFWRSSSSPRRTGAVSGDLVSATSVTQYLRVGHDAHDSATRPRASATRGSGGESALLQDLVPPLLPGALLQPVQAGACLTERGVAVPRLPGVAALPGADDPPIVRLVDRTEELAGDPSGSALGDLQALLDRAVPLGLA